MNYRGETLLQASRIRSHRGVTHANYLATPVGSVHQGEDSHAVAFAKASMPQRDGEGGR